LTMRTEEEIMRKMKMMTTMTTMTTTKTTRTTTLTTTMTVSENAEQYKVSNSMLSETNPSPIADLSFMSSIVVGVIIVELLK
jgi:hypothetical protein